MSSTASYYEQMHALGEPNKTPLTSLGMPESEVDESFETIDHDDSVTLVDSEAGDAFIEHLSSLNAALVELSDKQNSQSDKMLKFRSDMNKLKANHDDLDTKVQTVLNSLWVELVSKEAPNDRIEALEKGLKHEIATRRNQTEELYDAAEGFKMFAKVTAISFGAAQRRRSRVKVRLDRRRKAAKAVKAAREIEMRNLIEVVEKQGKQIEELRQCKSADHELEVRRLREKVASLENEVERMESEITAAREEARLRSTFLVAEVECVKLVLDRHDRIIGHLKTDLKEDIGAEISKVQESLGEQWRLMCKIIQDNTVLNQRLDGCAQPIDEMREGLRNILCEVVVRGRSQSEELDRLKEVVDQHHAAINEPVRNFKGMPFGERSPSPVLPEMESNLADADDNKDSNEDKDDDEQSETSAAEESTIDMLSIPGAFTGGLSSSETNLPWLRQAPVWNSATPTMPGSRSPTTAPPAPEFESFETFRSYLDFRNPVQ